MATHRVLLFEPVKEIRDRVKKMLSMHQMWVVETDSEAEAIRTLRQQFFHVCLWPIESKADTEELGRIKMMRHSTAFVVSSAQSDPDLVVSCMRAGASHFWLKTQNIDSLSEIVKRVLSQVSHEEMGEAGLDVPCFVGRHPKILEIFRLIKSIHSTESNVLITGESGTGKEVVARAIHEMSLRRSRPWVAVNCGAIPGTLLESELFGHMKGAFTGATQNRKGRFQLAGNGTLFLDEISELPFDLQVKILRAIQHRVFEPVGSPHSTHLDARIIAASNQNLETLVAERKFREDLFYRLNVIPIHIPPLRNRKSDIPLMIKHFAEIFCRKLNREFVGISEEVMKCLMEYHWPGNVRELENLIERVVVLKQEPGIIEMKDLPVQYFRQVKLDRFVANVELPDAGLDFNNAVNQFENELILQALQKTSGNKNRAANLLNLNRTTLVEKLKRKGLKIS